MKPLVIDTSVWIDWARGKKSNLIPLTKGRMILMPSVVYMELLAGASDRHSTKIIEQTIHPFIRHRRIVLPALKDFELAGKTLASLEWSATQQSNDVMICVLSRKVGAEVLTTNLKDFLRIGEKLKVTILTDFRI